jgi:hypothetical protein
VPLSHLQSGERAGLASAVVAGTLPAQGVAARPEWLSCGKSEHFAAAFIGRILPGPEGIAGSLMTRRRPGQGRWHMEAGAGHSVPACRAQAAILIEQGARA